MLSENIPDTAVVAGIDVGGERKGFHAVVLRGREVIGNFSSPDPRAISERCQEWGAQVVGVDAPCGWSAIAKSRLAERDLMRQGIHCFFSPTRDLAVRHPGTYYGWMFRGEALYSELQKTFVLFDGRRGAPILPACFETFPHAIACSLSGEIVPARIKRTVREALLRQAGIDTAQLSNIDWIDAALCAIAAQALLAGKVKMYGQANEGVIVVPDVQAVVSF